jgi:hypothetical protein
MVRGKPDMVHWTWRTIRFAYHVTPICWKPTFVSASLVELRATPSWCEHAPERYDPGARSNQALADVHASGMASHH